MSKYSKILEQTKTQKEIFLDNILEEFDQWFEKNSNSFPNTFNFSLSDINEVLETSNKSIVVE